MLTTLRAMRARRVRARLVDVHRDERGQMAITALLMFLVIALFFALAFDAGLWFFDHRLAQNQAEAAALAGVQELPNDDCTTSTPACTDAVTAINDWLDRNGSGPGDLCPSGVEFTDRSGDGRFETVRVCLRRDSPGIFAALSSVNFVTVSAAATATTGKAGIGNVMPWGIVPPDPACGIDTIDTDPEIQCEMDTDGDGAPDTECGVFLECPWGLHPDRVYAFKVSGTITPGNFGAIAACGNGATNYRDCIEGESVSNFYQEGETVNVDTQTGNLGANTNTALADRYPPSTWGNCDIAARPSLPLGLDAAGRMQAETTFADPLLGCGDRVVLVPVIDEFPQGSSSDITVLGVAAFGIASWDRSSPYGDALGDGSDECGTASGSAFECGMVWGYLLQDAQTPGFLVEQITDSDNPFAPLLIALVE